MSGIGTGHPPYDWRIDAIERKAEQAVSRLYEMDALRSNVDRLEHTMREISSALDGLRDEVRQLQTSIELMNTEAA